MRNRFIIIASIVFLLTSCKFKEVELIDFSAVSAQNKDWFQVTSIKETELGDEFPDDCYLPDGTKANDYKEDTESSESGLRTSYVSAATFMSNMLAYDSNRKVREISGTYSSVDEDGNPITLSGKVLLPANGPVKRIILVSHYTICSDAEAPSNSFPLEGVLSQMGYAMIFPDYIGYGITKNKIHPYLALELTARNVLDMFFAVKPWLAAAGKAPEKDDIYLMGYSQGGANTMAVQWVLETQHPEIKIKRVFAGGGPYDVKSTYETFVTSQVASYPVAVPLVIQGMNIAEKCGVDINIILQPYICQNLDRWINSKEYTSPQINSFIGTKNASEILTKIGMDRSSKEVALLYKAMQKNSIVNVNWYPKAAVYMLHSMNDETVPFINAQIAKATWDDSNIQYNFGTYGTHVITALRFIFSVKSLLEEEIN